MKPLPKVQAGGIIRVSLDNTWRTPEKILEPVRGYFGGEIPFDAATGLDNPTRARVYAVGYLPDEEKARLAYNAARGLVMSAAMGMGCVAAGMHTVHGVSHVCFNVNGGFREGEAFAEWQRVVQPLATNRLPWKSGLDVSWREMGGTYVNPPYGRELKAWLAKIEHESRRGAEIVALIPCSRWEQRYFTSMLERANALCFIRSRVAFISSIDGVAVGGNPFASMLLGFNVDPSDFELSFETLGACFHIEGMSDGATSLLEPVRAGDCFNACVCCDHKAPCAESGEGRACAKAECRECREEDGRDEIYGEPTGGEPGEAGAPFVSIRQAPASPSPEEWPVPPFKHEFKRGETVRIDLDPKELGGES